MWGEDRVDSLISSGEEYGKKFFLIHACPACSIYFTWRILYYSTIVPYPLFHARAYYYVLYSLSIVQQENCTKILVENRTKQLIVIENKNS